MPQRMPRVFAVAALALVLVGSGAARAQWIPVLPYRRTIERPHFYVGAGFVANAVLHQTGRDFLASGSGFRLTLGGRLSRRLALEANWQPTFHDRALGAWGWSFGAFSLNAFTFDLKIYPSGRGPIQGYLVTGAGGYVLDDAYGTFTSGPGFQLGGGVDFWLSPWISLGLEAQYRGAVSFNFDSFGSDTYVSAVTGLLDVTGRF